MSNAVHKTTVVTADDGVSEVGSDEWNSDHQVRIPTGGGALETDHMALTQRFIAEGTGRLTVREPLLYIRGSYGVGTQEVRDDNYLLQYKRAGFYGNARMTLGGNAELFVFDLAPVGRLVLAGRGG